jgi:hypothetical protein
MNMVMNCLGPDCKLLAQVSEALASQENLQPMKLANSEHDVQSCLLGYTAV